LNRTDVTQTPSETDTTVRNENSTTTSNQNTSGTTSDSGQTNTQTTVTQLPNVGTYYDTATESYVTRKRDPFVGGTFDAQNGGTLRLGLLDNAIDLQFALRALSKNIEAKLLANPRVLVLDNETANFEIVREIPYRELQQIGRADPITYTAFKNVGVQLKVTPHMAAGGMIRLRISPQFGILVSQNIDGVPTVDTRRADTTAMLKDGQTIVIGGLRKREVSKTVSKVPVLGDMPLVNGLFRSQTESTQINELVVFITTRIVREPVLSDSEKQQLRTSQIGTRDIKDIEAERELTEKLLKSLSEKK
jgi:type II secretory pathway component GspD/PulD (secretin)